MLLRGRNSRTANSTKSSPWCENSQRQPSRPVNNSAWTRWRAFCDRVTVVALRPFLLLVCCPKRVTCGGLLFIAGSCFETAVQTFQGSQPSISLWSWWVGIFDTFYLLLERVCWRKWLFVETAAINFFLLLGIGGMTDFLAHFSGQSFVTAYAIYVHLVQIAFMFIHKTVPLFIVRSSLQTQSHTTIKCTDLADEHQK